MDQRVIGWARAVKQRQCNRLPVLWLFTDAARLPDPLAAIASLPKNLCGVVFRHDNPDLAAQAARLCKFRGVALVIAGDTRLARRLGCGVHLRRGRWPGLPRRRAGLITASAHNVAELRQAELAGAQIVFISPVFATASHRGAATLGSVRSADLAKRAHDMKPYALGGVNRQTIFLLPRVYAGCGAITLFAKDIS